MLLACMSIPSSSSNERDSVRKSKIDVSYMVGLTSNRHQLVSGPKPQELGHVRVRLQPVICRTRSSTLPIIPSLTRDFVIFSGPCCRV